MTGLFSKKIFLAGFLQMLFLFFSVIIVAHADDSGVAGSHFEITREGESEARTVLYRDSFSVNYETKTFQIPVSENRLSLGFELVTSEEDVFGDIEKIDLLVCGSSISPKQARYSGTGDDILED